VDNDGDGATDLADPQCHAPTENAEAPSGCGLGIELAAALALLAAARARLHSTA
jgi:hypothetical protein